jgi:hypothetical protein
MFLARRLATFAAVTGALAVGAPAAPASAATPPPPPVISGPSCPSWYDGPTNLATGCPYWLMTYTVALPGIGPPPGPQLPAIGPPPGPQFPAIGPPPGP